MKNFNVRIWTISHTIALVLFFSLIGMLYHIITTYKAYPNQISSMNEVERLTTLFQKKYYSKTYGEPLFIPTGFYIESFLFKDPNTIQFSGVIWQKYPKKAIKQESDLKVDFPEATSSTTMEKIYDIDEGDYRLIGWRFVGLTLYESFDYALYPLDKQSIWIEARPKQFYKNTILTPDLSSYKSTKPYDTFGLRSDITVFEYDIKETFFEYFYYTVDTSLGFNNFTALSNPALYFEIILQRQFIDSFILHLLPIIVILSILFGFTMIMTPIATKSQVLGASTTGLLSSLGGIFFAVVIANLNLRTKFIGQPPTYMEYYYFITYLAIFLLSINVHLISPSGRSIPSILAWRNNLLPKIIFWPFILGSLLLVTVVKFSGHL